MLRPTLLTLLILGLATPVLVSSPPAEAKRSRPKYCQKKRQNVRVFGIGSSTMGSVLGPMLKKILKKDNVTARYWGKASSGLARPDFHDWFAQVPKIIKRYKPDIFIVSLGTNDGQHMYNKGKWIRYQDPRWAKAYAERVDRFLKLLAGPGGKRPILWLGPTALPHQRSAKRMELIRKIIKQRVRRFKKKARFIDGIELTTHKNGDIKKSVKIPGTEKMVPARASDNIHLTKKGVRWLLAEPILKRLRKCI